MLVPTVTGVQSSPVFDGYFADPFVWRHENNYYAVGTGAAEACGTKSQRVFPLLVSKDLQEWRQLENALVRPPGNLGDNFWAPEVAFANGTFYMYYSVGHGDAGHKLRAATSSNPAGPYEDTGTVLLGGADCPFAIDPHPFQDRDGSWYLFYATDFLDTAAPWRAGTGLKVARLETMTKLENSGCVVARARSDWQRFQSGRSIYGGVWDWHTLEGPSVTVHAGRYFCFYSGGRWENETYGVDFAVADHVLGPYSDRGNETGPRVLRTSPGKLLGPGHNSLVRTPHGLKIVFHAWDSGMTGRRMFIADLSWCERR